METSLQEYKLAANSLGVRGRWRYYLPLVLFLIFVAAELIVLVKCGYLRDLESQVVEYGAGALTVFAMLCSFFATVFLRLEGLFDDLTHMTGEKMQPEDDLRARGNLRRKLLESQRRLRSRLRYYYPLLLFVLFVAVEVAVLKSCGYLQNLEEQLVEYGALGLTLFVFLCCLFVTVYVRIEGLFDDLSHEVGEKIEAAEEWLVNVTHLDHMSCQRCGWQCV
eukprot:gb/GFBE01074084.1/.p1 GENE.gb/GFBE01074084.1/~~gb/GFBE01074084.1/.p1  ORF type:complete len:221 (+),score=51.25 gb/GFBE01074084.1/:1-663(+)